MNLKYLKNKKGFVILFALMLSSIILAVSLGISNITLKETYFSTSAKATNNAFFAADTGIECALYHDRSDINAFPISGFVEDVNCSEDETGEGDGYYAIYYFTVKGIDEKSQSCAKVTIEKDLSGTTIISKGYNMGDSLCNSTNLNRVEREIRITY